MDPPPDFPVRGSANTQAAGDFGVSKEKQSSEPLTASVDAIGASLVEQMFGSTPNLLFSLKDEALRFIAANDAMVTLCCASHRRSLIGRRSGDFFPKEAQERYEAIDRLVLRTGRPVTDVLDLAVRPRGKPAWVVISRYPIRETATNDVRAVACVGRMLDVGRRGASYARVMAAIRYAEAHFDAKIGVADLAQRAGVSVIQLERDFDRVFGCTPHRYLTKIRLEAALPLLEGDLPIAEVAQLCGYGDQSSFARRFKATTGFSPNQYRNLRAKDASPRSPAPSERRNPDGRTEKRCQ